SGEVALVADRRRGDRAKRLAACRTGAVRRQHLHIVGQGEETVAEAREEILRALEAGVDEAGGLIEQVGSTQVTDEHEVPCEHETRLARLSTVRDQEREMLRG